MKKHKSQLCTFDLLKCKTYLKSAKTKITFNYSSFQKCKLTLKSAIEVYALYHVCAYPFLRFSSEFQLLTY